MSTSEHQSPHCRFCGEPLTQTFADLGAMALANSYLPSIEDAASERVFPLHARVCGHCRLVQVENAVPPDAIFSDYAYFSSYASSWVEHARAYTEMARQRFALTPQSQVIEIASNDGYLLKHFVAADIPVLGVEPAANVAAAAEAIGVPTRVAFFGQDLAGQLRREGLAADLLLGNNVLAHVPDLNDFVAGLALLLKDDGVLTMEFPHLLRLIEDVQFDTIYHEHFSYFSLLTVEQVFAAHGLRLFDVEELPTHGGSLRIFACHRENALQVDGAGLAIVRDKESRAGLDGHDIYAQFQDRVATVRDGLLAFLARAREDDKRVVAYGAAAKGNTLLNFCGVGPDDLAYVVDVSPYKQGRYLPGSHIPIKPVEYLREDRPDYV
ncbi:MAG: methyltransferase domain-containing protein, partial [Alphaproteobacteria bacterium]|nr:methyltransferase domain-containing protein [Alphaproteobacteria bacterium]